MFKNLTYKKKNQFLAAASLVVLVCFYRFDVNTTVALHRQVNELAGQIEIAKDAPQKVGLMEVKLGQMDLLSGLKHNSDTSIQQELLGVVTGYCQQNAVVLRGFPKTMVSEAEGFRVETNVFTAEGGFTKLLELVYLLEQKNRVGKVASVLYNTKKEVTTRSLSLTAAVYLQNIKKVKNEN